MPVICAAFGLNENAVRPILQKIATKRSGDKSEWSLIQDKSDRQIEEMCTPEMVCRYESMKAGKMRLKSK